MLSLIQELCAIPGVSGDEGRVREFLKSRAADYADDIKEDAVGNLCVLRRGEKANGGTLMLAAHMDEVGFIVKSITKDGLLKFGSVGGIDRRVAIGRRVRVGANGMLGIISLRAKHLVSGEEENRVPPWDALAIDIGAQTREEAAQKVKLGDGVVFDSPCVTFGEGFIKGKALDDRAGCAVLLTLLQGKRPPADTWFVFTAAEEIGTRGALGAAFALKPDAALVVEGTTAADTPDVDPSKQVCRPGGGIVFPFMDNGTIYDRTLWRLLCRCAEREGIAWQTKELIAGGTDGAAIQRRGAGVKVAGAALAIRYIHGPSCVAKIDEIAQLVKVCEAFVHEWGHQRV